MALSGRQNPDKLSIHSFRVRNISWINSIFFTARRHSSRSQGVEIWMAPLKPNDRTFGSAGMKVLVPKGEPPPMAQRGSQSSGSWGCSGRGRSQMPQKQKAKKVVTVLMGWVILISKEKLDCCPKMDPRGISGAPLGTSMSKTKY